MLNKKEEENFEQYASQNSFGGYRSLSTSIPDEIQRLGKCNNLLAKFYLYFSRE